MASLVPAAGLVTLPERWNSSSDLGSSAEPPTEGTACRARLKRWSIGAALQRPTYRLRRPLAPSRTNPPIPIYPWHLLVVWQAPLAPPFAAATTVPAQPDTSPIDQLSPWHKYRPTCSG